MATSIPSEILKKYSVRADDVVGEVSIFQNKKDYVPTYSMEFPKSGTGTEAVLKTARNEIIRNVNISPEELLNPKASGDIKSKFTESANSIIGRILPGADEEVRKYLVGSLVHEMFGLGPVELLLKDDDIEEIVVNGSEEPIWVYHKKHGWLQSDMKISDESQIQNYASIIGRRVGKDINNLQPLMDAHLLSGDRVNSTLFPISTKGNTLTIRKFARNPWTITDMVDPHINTVSKEIASLLWMAIQYELNVIVGGGTASGKTSFLNTLAPFVQPNQRIISIEDTRELQLPSFAHWIPLTTREPNSEGRGKVDMLDLMINSLRMRPDRMIVGEIRRQDQAQVMLEAMHTGHSMYSTIHANNADELYSRLINPPINIPESQLEVVNLAVIQFRHRRMNMRRTFQLAEFVPRLRDGQRRMDVNILYQWQPTTDKIERVGEFARFFKDIGEITGLTEKEIYSDLKEKESILEWMVSNNVKTVNAVGKLVADYYKDPDYILDIVKKKKKPDQVFTPDIILDLMLRGHYKKEAGSG